MDCSDIAAVRRMKTVALLALALACTRAGAGEKPSHGYPGPSLDDSLAMTPWERMLANDDALNFAESLRTAMERRNAASEP